jgi:hypothetical protein
MNKIKETLKNLELNITLLEFNFNLREIETKDNITISNRIILKELTEIKEELKKQYLKISDKKTDI